MTGRIKMAVCCAVLMALASTASADNARKDDSGREISTPPANWVFGSHTGDAFCDDFDSYTLGPVTPQTPEWEMWAGSVDVSGIVTTDQAFSPPHSLAIIGTPPGSTGLGDDTVHVNSPLINGGVWVFSLMTYVPTGMTGHGWIILQNTYEPPYIPGNGLNWSLQVHLQGDGRVVADFDLEEIPLIFDQWVEFRAEIDLPNDSVDYFYDGVQFVFGKSWIDGVGETGVSNIASIDLYGGDAGAPGGPTTGVFYDDVKLFEVGGPGCGCG
ncbi:MAG: hypothetical protein IID33_09355, partial [Planctomycetes bacterium]|nr:hypothetical protein [Planctomycetota bacterium]